MEQRLRNELRLTSFSGPEDWRNRSNLMSISELFSELRDTFIGGDFDLVEKILIDREERLKKEIEEKKKELELAEERMKFEKLERVTLEFKLERLQAEMNKKMLMKKNGERGDREERLKKEIEEKKKELELFEERMKFEKLERVTLEFKLEKLQAEMNKKALTMKNGNQSGDVGAVKNRFVSDNEGVASADVEKASQHVGVWVKEKKKVDEQRKKDGLGVSDMEEPPLKRLRGKRGLCATASLQQEREMTPQQEGGQHAQRVRSHPKVDEEEHKEEEQDAQHDEEEEEEEEMKDAKDENMMDVCGDEQEEMVVQVAKINAETFIYPKPEPAEFSGGPMDKSVLTLYTGHIARHIFDGQVRKDLTVVSHGKKVLKFDTPNEDWFHTKMESTGLANLSLTSYEFLDSALISAFVERWHEETSSFHLPSGEITITLDDVSCLLHLPIEGSLLDHEGIMTRDEGVLMMVTLLGVKPFDAKTHVIGTKSPRVKISYLEELFASHVQSVARYTKKGKLEESNKFQDYTIRVYLLMLVGWTIFADKSKKNIVHLTYLKYFEDLEKVGNYAWGAAALTHMYKGLTVATVPKVKGIAGYMTLLQAWIIQHFPSLCGRFENERYIEVQPVANKFLQKEQKSIEEYRLALDKMHITDIYWDPYDDHRVIRPFKEISFYSGWIRCGPMMVKYLPERVLRQFGRVQTIPRHPSHSAVPLTPLPQISLQYTQYMDWVLTAEQRGDLSLYPWYAAPGYIEWYFLISHPYMIPLPS